MISVTLGFASSIDTCGARKKFKYNANYMLYDGGVEGGGGGGDDDEASSAGAAASVSLASFASASMRSRARTTFDWMYAEWYRGPAPRPVKNLEFCGAAPSAAFALSTTGGPFARNKCS